VNILLLPCEVSVKTVLPAIKALMARDIVENYGMKEKQVAEILGLSQSAISRYTTKNRGNILILENEPEVQKIVSQMTTFLIYEPQEGNFCTFLHRLHNNTKKRVNVRTLQGKNA